jgi:starch phosphorylase
MADIGITAAARMRCDGAWLDPHRWNRMSLLNTARCGFFSS